MDGVCNDHSRLLAGAIIALKDMNEHYYLAVEETGTNSGTFRLVGVLHYSLIGDRALFKVEMHHILFVVKITSWFLVKVFIELQLHTSYCTQI